MTDLLTPPAPPTATPPPELTPGGRTALRIVIVIAAALLLVVGLGALAAAAVGIGNTRVVADNQTLSAAMRTLTINTGAVPMSVQIESDPAAREPRAELRFVSASGNRDQALEITGDTDTEITVRGSTPDWMEWAQAGQLTVVLPPDVGERLTVTTDQQLGVLQMDADVDRLVARSNGGAVILEGSARSIEAEVRQGAVVADEPILVRDSFSANVTEGHIEVDFRDSAPPVIDAITSNGDVRLGLPGDGPFLVDASSGSYGDSTVVEVPQTDDRGAAESVVTARASGGSVVVEQAR